jgi:hypothetical protein
MLIQHRLGIFSYAFEPGGKLKMLSVEGGFNLLYEGKVAFDITGGLTFRIAGWDEVFPTIEPYDETPLMGCLVRSAPSIERDQSMICQAWQLEEFKAQRTFTLLDECCLKLAFAVENTSLRPIEFLWASHPMLAVDHLQRVDLPDGSRLDDFSPDGSERKWFVRTGVPVRMVYPGFAIDLQTDQPWWGLWLDKGGWPVEHPGEVHCLGIEATNTPAEVPCGQILQPGEKFQGALTLAWAAN